MPAARWTLAWITAGLSAVGVATLAVAQVAPVTAVPLARGNPIQIEVVLPAAAQTLKRAVIAVELGLTDIAPGTRVIVHEAKTGELVGSIAVFGVRNSPSATYNIALSKDIEAAARRDGGKLKLTLVLDTRQVESPGRAASAPSTTAQGGVQLKSIKSKLVDTTE